MGLNGFEWVCVDRIVVLRQHGRRSYVMIFYCRPLTSDPSTIHPFTHSPFTHSPFTHSPIHPFTIHPFTHSPIHHLTHLTFPHFPPMPPAAPNPLRLGLVEYFNKLAPERDRWTARNRYYHRELERAFSFLIPPGRSVLELGSGTGNLLAALRPSRGLGLDLSPAMTVIARNKFPQLEFRTGDLEELDLDEKFDYVVLSDLIGFVYDVQRSLENLRQVCTTRTRVIISYYNFLWAPVLKAAERLGLKPRQPFQNWLAPADVENLLELAGFEVIRKLTRLLLPVNIPALAPLCNRLGANLPGARKLSLVYLVVARPRPSVGRDSGAGVPPGS